MKRSKSMAMTIVGCLVLWATAVSADVISDLIQQFQPSVLTEQEQQAELAWFQGKAKELDLAGVEVLSTSEILATHKYETEVLTKAFRELTGITVTHTMQPENTLVEELIEQLGSKGAITHHQIYVNDTDLIGIHARSKHVLDLRAYLDNEGKTLQDPYYDWDDFLFLKGGQGFQGEQYQIPDQTFPILLWYRYDLFTDPKYKQLFAETDGKQYGIELGVPRNWPAYEIIAKFWSETVKEIDGKKIYGHFDYAGRRIDLSWRFADKMLEVGGAADPVGTVSGIGDWGIRLDEQNNPVGVTVARGGSLNGPAAVDTLETFIRLLKYAPPVCKNIGWYDVAEMLPSSNAVMTWYFCTTFASNFSGFLSNSPIVDANGVPLWRLAPMPVGAYHQPGMWSGYLDQGVWARTKISHLPWCNISTGNSNSSVSTKKCWWYARVGRWNA